MRSRKEKSGQQSILALNRRMVRQNQKIFVVMSILFLAVTGYFLWNLRGIQKENVQIKETVSELENDNLNEQNSVFKMCLASDEQSRNEYAKRSDSYDVKIQEHIKGLRELLPGEKENFVKIQKILQEALRKRQMAILSARGGESGQQALQILNDDYAPKMQQIDELCRGISERVTQRSQMRMNQMQVVIGITVIILLLVTVVLVLVSNRQKAKMERLFRVPVQEIMTAMKELENGNLSYKSDYHSENEMGILNDSIRCTVETLRGYIANIEQNLQALSRKEYDVENNYEYKGDFVRISEAMDCIISELNETMKQISDGIQVVEHTGGMVNRTAVDLARDTMANAATIEQFTASIEEIVAQVKRNLGRMDMVNEQETEITGWIEECSGVIQGLHEIMEETVSSTQQLYGFMGDMDELSSLINLLSLNASIEAARAGAAGKGFAVVAEEIRKLSDQTVEITGKSKRYIRECADDVQEGMKEVKSASEGIARITGRIHEIRDMVQDTARVSEAQLQEMQNFEDGVVEMAKIVQKDSDLAGNLEREAIDMEAAVKQIGERMMEFKLRAGRS